MFKMQQASNLHNEFLGCKNIKEVKVILDIIPGIFLKTDGIVKSSKIKTLIDDKNIDDIPEDFGLRERVKELGEA